MIFQRNNIAIVAGGDSGEYEVSLRSAVGLFSFIPDDYKKYIVLIKGAKWNVVLNSDRRTCPLNDDGSIRSDSFVVELDRNEFSFTCFVGTDGRFYARRPRRACGSAEAPVAALPEKVVLDYAYVTIHGTPGENGLLQGYLAMMGIPHSTCGVLPAALTFDKFTCNRYLSTFGIRVADSDVYRRRDPLPDPDELVARFGLPLFVKPVAGGSSCGVTKVKSAEDLIPAFRLAMNQNSDAMVERFMDGREITVGIFSVDGRETVLPPFEVTSNNEYFDYNAKYNGESHEFPAELSPSLDSELRETTKRVYNAIHAHGIIRVDYIVTEGDTVNLLEVNTTPGMTRQSFIPQMMRAAGLDIHQVMQQIIESK